MPVFEIISLYIPIYYNLEYICRDDISDEINIHWLYYWLLRAIYTAIFSHIEFILLWIPFWYTLKTIFFAYIMFPRFKATIMFMNIIVNFVDDTEIFKILKSALITIRRNISHPDEITENLRKIGIFIKKIYCILLKHPVTSPLRKKYSYLSNLLLDLKEEIKDLLKEDSIKSD